MGGELTLWPIDDADAGDPAVSVRGRCVDFCAATGPFEGAAVDQHGPWCVSRPCGREVIADTDNGSSEITVELVAAYLDGAYARADYLRVSGKRYVRVRMDSESGDEQSIMLYLGSGTARQLAASLNRAADHVDQLDAPLTDALRQRVAWALTP